MIAGSLALEDAPFAFEAIIRRVHEHVANGRGVKNARVIERGKLHDQ